MVIFLGTIVFSNLNLVSSTNTGSNSTDAVDKQVYMYLSLASSTGDIKGSVVAAGHEGSIEVFSISHSIVQETDPATGQATGKRQHKPFVITKELDQASPLLAKALTNVETLTTWSLGFWRASATSGKMENYYTIELTNAQVSSIVTRGSNFGVIEMVSFTYQKITWTWVDGGITHQDDWSAPVV